MAKKPALKRKKSQFFVVRDHINAIKLHKSRAAAQLAAQEIANKSDNSTNARVYVGRLIGEVKTVKQFEWV